MCYVRWRMWKNWTYCNNAVIIYVHSAWTLYPLSVKLHCITTRVRPTENSVTSWMCSYLNLNFTREDNTYKHSTTDRCEIMLPCLLVLPQPQMEVCLLFNGCISRWCLLSVVWRLQLCVLNVSEWHLCFGGGFTLSCCLCRQPARPIDQAAIVEGLESAQALFTGQYCMVCMSGPIFAAFWSMSMFSALGRVPTVEPKHLKLCVTFPIKEHSVFRSGCRRSRDTDPFVGSGSRWR
jgi:hypothetical protein